MLTKVCIVKAKVFPLVVINKLQHAVPVQQGYIKPQPSTENITHPQMDTTVRALRLETSKKGKPTALHHPSSAGSSQKDLDTPIPKELGLLSLEGGMLGSENRKQESKMAVAKTRKGKAGKNRTKEGQRKVQGPE